METKEKRLKFYRMMLRDYSWNLFIPPKFRHHRFHAGMCHYITSTANFWIYSFPELIKQKPNITYSAFWFFPGKVYPRIKCIKNAIKLCKKQ